MQKWTTIFKGAGPSGHVCHFKGATGGDYTLCGLSLSGDPDLYDRDPFPVTPGYGKVNCPDCIKIVEAVRKIKGNEIEK